MGSGIMTSSIRSIIADLMATVEEQKNGLFQLQNSMTEMTGSATSPRRELSVTVDPRGAVVAMKFLSQSYRKMAAEELAAMILATIGSAQQDMRDQMRQRMAEIGPPGTKLTDFATGASDDWAGMFAEAMQLPPEIMEVLTSPEPILPDFSKLPKPNEDTSPTS